MEFWTLDSVGAFDVRTSNAEIVFSVALTSLTLSDRQTRPLYPTRARALHALAHDSTIGARLPEQCVYDLPIVEKCNLLGISGRSISHVLVQSLHAVERCRHCLAVGTRKLFVRLAALQLLQNFLALLGERRRFQSKPSGVELRARIDARAKDEDKADQSEHDIPIHNVSSLPLLRCKSVMSMIAQRRILS
ncbi:hypothetical protein [Luteimonas terrae]|uniref:Uncharacterized protein n=1 Tax=Luteimonas terrae TaxID=1530191 RepID=A0A4R5UET9_9GAMM|nr:hypothetical protein [Luteimonas terrae]TDK33838.1 hypothetical protein E2F49_07595 [Luteimonas terrae]